MLEKLSDIIKYYIDDVKIILGTEFLQAVIYGSLARNEYTEESDIDIAIFTNVEPEDFYKLIDDISEVTFEYNVRYDVMLSPVFINKQNYEKMFQVMPYYQNIAREGIAVG